MDQFNCLTIILLPILSLYSGSVLGVKIGDSCSFDQDCSIPQTYCRDRSTCDCRPGFYSNPQQTMCYATIEAVCKTDSDCSSLTGSSCKLNVCTCREEDYVPHSGKRSCLPIATSYQQECEEDKQCISGFGGQAFCNSKQCVCRTNYHFTNTNSNRNFQCIRNKGLDETCTDNECYIDENSKQMITCRAGRCVCNNGYVRQDNYCKAGAASLPITASAIVIFTIMNLVMNKR